MSIDYVRLIQETSAYKTLLKEMKKPSHAYLIISEDEELIPPLFEMLAIDLFCAHNGCFECPECKKILSRQHPDIRYISAARGLNAKEVGELIMQAYTASVEGKEKLFFFEDFGALDPRVQNKLLKTLEEPPENSVFFLASKGESGVLNTVKSRAKKLYIDLFSEETLIEALTHDNITLKKAKIAASSAGGLITKARKTAEDERFLRLYDEALEILFNLKRSSDIARFFNSECFEKDNLAEALEIFQLIFRDIMLFTTGKGRKSVYKAEEMQTLSEEFSTEAAASLVGQTVKLMKELYFNVRVPVVAEELLFNILEAKHKWQK